MRNITTAVGSSDGARMAVPCCLGGKPKRLLLCAQSRRTPLHHAKKRQGYARLAGRRG